MITKRNGLILFGLLILIYLLFFYKSEHVQTNPHIEDIKEKFSKIDPKYKDVNIVHGDPGGGSYTIGKKKIVMCTVDPVTREPYDEHTQMYVALHELAHVITKNYDEHGPEFQRNFKHLLLEAQRKGVYRPIYSPPATYCT
jgi:hypothetical protein